VSRSPEEQSPFCDLETRDLLNLVKLLCSAVPTLVIVIYDGGIAGSFFTPRSSVDITL
jgi:hypothetical protein